MLFIKRQKTLINFGLRLYRSKKLSDIESYTTCFFLFLQAKNEKYLNKMKKESKFNDILISYVFI